MSAIANHPHRVSSAVAGVRSALASVAAVPVWSMDATEPAVIDDVLRADAQLAELKARLLAHADRIDIAAETGATKTATWHAHQPRTRRPVAFAAIRLATGLDTHGLTRTALAQGRVHVEQAEAILRALADLPDDLDPHIAEQAERHLLEQAASFDAKALKHLGRRILQVASPDAADAADATKPSSSSARNAPPPRRPG